MVWPNWLGGFVGYFRIELAKKKAARSGHESSSKAGLSGA